MADLIGQPLRRREDHRLVTGRGRYVADVPLDAALHAVVVRSPHAHARIVSVDVRHARTYPGVAGVFTLVDLPELRGALPPPAVAATAVKPYRQSALADGLVRFVGEPVAVVVAADAYQASDAAASVSVQYDVLPPVVDPERALEAGAPLVHAEWGDNVAATVSLAHGDVDAALARAHLVVTRRLRCGRLTALPLEARAVAARWDAGTASLHVWASTQMPYGVRQRIAEALDLAPDAVRVTAPDVGGGFGTKGPVYPEDLIVAALARRLGRAVRWSDTRQDSFVSTTHAGDQLHTATLALAADGTILALADDFLIDAGAYLPRGAVVAGVTAPHLLGLYRIPAFRCRGRVAVTHKVPCAPYRGAGRTQATFVAERMLDIAAREIGMDPIELRRRNVIGASEMPYDRGLAYRDGMPMVYDSGDYAALLETAVKRGGVEAFRAHQRAARRQGRWLGDTARFPSSAGTFASRVAVLVGNAVAQAAEAVRDQARGLAAAALECDPDDVVVADGRAHVKGAPHRALGLAQLAALAERPDAGRTLGEPGLSATRYHSPERVTWAAGVHVAAVEVDRETGAVSVLAYHAVHDAGHEINPLIVEGQTQGGAVQGIGAALGEEVVYDDGGQVLTGTLMEYALPRADGVPPIDVTGCDSLSPLNPLGAKGTGEGSAVPGPAAIANAVADALDGVEIVQTPLRPALLVRA
jgi:carbon-monoxide dehydrogenase large subunit